MLCSKMSKRRRKLAGDDDDDHHVDDEGEREGIHLNVSLLYLCAVVWRNNAFSHIPTHFSFFFSSKCKW